jgi:ketosteroid isomerase-like protein
MSKPRNVETVEAIYAAFGRGDIPAILERLAPDVAWEEGGVDHGVPWLVPRQGRKGAAAFFETLAGIDIEDFRVFQITSGGPYVVALVSIDFEVKATGRRVRDTCEAHVWRFDDAGRVVSMRHAADTHQHKLAAA